MTTSNAIEQTRNITNGVDIGQITNVIGAIEADPSFAKFQFRATNQWIDGGLSRSRIKEFFAGNAEDTTRKQQLSLPRMSPQLTG